MKRIKKGVCALIFILTVVGLQGCAATLETKIDSGHYHAGMADFEKAGTDYNTVKLHTHFGLCEGYLLTKDFDSFFSCYDLLEAKLEQNKGRLRTMAGAFWTYNKPYGRAKINAKLARAYLAIGDTDKAINTAENALALIDEADSRVINGMALVSNKRAKELESISLIGVLAVANAKKGQSEIATKMINWLKSIKVSGMAGPLAPEKRMWIARAFYEIKNYQQALAVLEDDSDGAFYAAFHTFANYYLKLSTPIGWAFAVADPVGMDLMAKKFVLEADNLFFHCALLLKNNRLEEAKKGYNDLLSQATIKGFGSLVYGSLHGLGQIAVAEGDLAAGIDYFKRAIDIIEEQRASINTEKYKISFVGNKQEIYCDLVSALVRAKRPAEAFNYAERGKARALVDLLASKKNFKGKHNQSEVASLLAELDRLEHDSKLFVAPADDTNGTRAIKLVQKKICASAPEIASMVTVSTLNATDVQASLRPDEALIEYFYQGQEGFFAFVVTQDELDVFPLKSQGLKRAVGQFRTAINAYDSDDWVVSSSRLYERLIAPLADIICDKKHLTMVPHGVLHYLPFNALKRGNGKFLIENHTIRTLPSASVLKFLNNPTGQAQNFLVLGNPTLDLPGAEVEAMAIASLWSDSKVIMRQNASESLVKKAGGTFKYIHLASHGIYNPDNPLQSEVMLSADKENDGHLTVPEIYDLRLNANMVVLSACQTSLGNVNDGDDVIGLTRGFLFAGARSIVGSLWDVPDDPTKDLMVTLYQNLKSTDARTAMQQAQLANLKKYKHPFAWAAFQITGGS